MKPWFNVNFELLTCIITHGNSGKVAQSQTHLSRIGVCTSHAYMLVGANWNHKRLHSVLKAF